MSEKYIYDFEDRKGLLNKLQSYAETQDDENIRVKEKVKNALLHCPELLYALHETDLEDELFDDDGNLNVDENGEPLGEWDRYFGANGNIRPYLFFPEVQDHARNFLCYQTGFKDTPKYNSVEKYASLTMLIFIHTKDTIDEPTGIPRHDLIASILREKFNWSNILGTQCSMSLNSEYTSDTNYVVRKVVFEATNTNALTKTINGKTQMINKFRSV
jgi:hypothetical protein